ncbi:MAG TPA: LuxR C-terminal-related transcriptional regulator [Ktedonobacteraceae bacterium]|nr:LuxR C-terminal-related transcriptional regulator [Ktedonobacteraceae bacterium]
MPKSAFYSLIWSSSHGAYELYKGREDEAVELIPGSSIWLEGVKEFSSFAFHGQHGSYTARKERKQRGEGYWYAYARVEGKLNKRYLGRSVDLAFARLEQVAQELWRNPLDGLLQTDHAEAANSAKSSDLSGLSVYDTTMPSVPAYLPLHSVQRQGNGSRTRKSVSVLSKQQTDPLLTTKLHMPHLPAQLVHRPRLIQRLQQGLERSLILLSAPAGFGKSTLLSDWLASKSIPVVWLSLEPQDNDLTRFLSYLLAALQTYEPHLGKSVEALLQPLHAPPLETVLTLLLNDLMTRRSANQDHVVLVLDDYHVIANKTIHQALFLMMDYLPPQLHLVLSTREDPPFPLARLRGRDAVLELRAADLQCTPEETASYLVDMMGLSLSAEQSSLLQLRTEGWITGLQLAAHSLQNHDDPAGFITAFSGSHRYVMDYLLEEVLNRQPAVQDFLLQTCILDRLSSSLCDAVRAQDGSQAVLDYLERANLFLIALDDDRQWYRYHRLFAQVLYQRLQQTAPTQVPVLHRRASRWYEQHELFAEAVSHALAASAFEEAARLIEQYAGVFILGNQMQALCEWLYALPESLVLAHPSLCLVHALALMYTNRLDEASTRLQMVEQGLDLGEDNRQDAQGRILLGQVVACRSILTRLSGDLKRSVILARQALDLLPETGAAQFTRILHAGALFSAAHEYLVSGDVGPDSERLLMKLIGDARAANYRLLTLKGLLLLARLRLLQGQLHLASTTYEEVVRVVSRTEELQVLVDSAVYYFGMGDLFREWNELEAAEQHLVRGMDLLSGALSIDTDKVWLGYSRLAQLQQARGRYDLALATLDAFVLLAQQRPIPPLLMAQSAALRAHMELAQGNLLAGRRWANTSGLSTNDPLGRDEYGLYLREREYLTLVRVRITEKRINPMESSLSEVLSLLERLLSDADTNRRRHSMLEMLVLHALALEAQGNQTAALTVLNRVLKLAEPEGYVRLFLDEGQPMIALLRQAQRHGIAPNYVARLLALVRESEAICTHPLDPNANSPVEPLTAREREVLQLMLNGATNREIAGELTVSVNTVKKHVLNICDKLSVRSRTQAIAKARNLHLL